MIEQPTPEQLAFHEEVKSILDKHQAILGELPMVAILAQVAGSIGAITMLFDGLTQSSLEQTIAHNARIGINTGVTMIHASTKGNN